MAQRAPKTLAPLVISLGGSAVVPNTIAVRFLKAFRKLILLVAKRRQVIIVVGGGGVNRQYNAAARAVAEITDVDLDWIGIATTRLNAELVRATFGSAASARLLGDPTKRAATAKRILVGAGWLPGHSTDMDAVLLAKTYGAKDIVNISNVSHVYTSDPQKDPRARPLPQLTWKEYRTLITSRWSPRLSTPFDPVAAKHAERLGLTVTFVRAGSIALLHAVMDGRRFNGTIIHP